MVRGSKILVLAALFLRLQWACCTTPDNNNLALRPSFRRVCYKIRRNNYLELELFARKLGRRCRSSTVERRLVEGWDSLPSSE